MTRLRKSKCQNPNAKVRKIQMSNAECQMTDNEHESRSTNTRVNVKAQMTNVNELVGSISLIGFIG